MTASRSACSSLREGFASRALATQRSKFLTFRALALAALVIAVQSSARSLAMTPARPLARNSSSVMCNGLPGPGTAGNRAQ